MYRLNRPFIIAGFLIPLFQLSASSQQLSSEPVEISLNHLVLCVDSNTYRNIENSEFLKNEFATYEHRTTVRSNDSYTGIYFYGTETYIEFFDADADTADQVGDCGLGLGTDYASSLITLRALLSDNYNLITDTVSRQLDSQLVPWFSYIAFEYPFIENKFVIDIWIMEYLPEFLEKWHPQKNDTGLGIKRKDVLDRYKSVLSGHVKEPIMSDIVGITMAADSQETGRIIALFTSIGFNVESSGAGTNLHRGDFSLNIVHESTDTCGLTEIRFRTNKKPAPIDQIDIGQKSVLSFPSDTVAIWTFHY